LQFWLKIALAVCVLENVVHGVLREVAGDAGLEGLRLADALLVGEGLGAAVCH
jgi:hypothetical protein